MSVMSTVFGGVRLSDDDAKKFKDQITYGRPKAAAVASPDEVRGNVVKAFIVLGRAPDLGRRTLGVAVTPLAPLERPFAERAVFLERRPGRPIGGIRGASFGRADGGRASRWPPDRGLGR